MQVHAESAPPSHENSPAYPGYRMNPEYAQNVNTGRREGSCLRLPDRSRMFTTV